MKALRIMLMAMYLSLPGCAAAAPILEGLAKVAQGTQFLSSAVAAAETGTAAYLARHPNQETERAVFKALREVKILILVLNEAISAGTAKDVEEARLHALEAYNALRELLYGLGIPQAVPPMGGAETNADKPQPFELPTTNKLERAM